MFVKAAYLQYLCVGVYLSLSLWDFQLIRDNSVTKPLNLRTNRHRYMEREEKNRRN